MDSEINYDDIEHILDQIPDNFSILEETINVEVQKEYFETSATIKKDAEKDSTEQLIEALKDLTISIEEQKLVLQKLALTDQVEAFRAIESFVEHAPVEIKDWTVLALQQSRMMMQTSLLDEQQVFISTGLGGRKNKLRYFLIFPFKKRNNIGDVQKKSLEQELNYFLGRNGSEMEEISFEDDYATATALIPLKAPVAEIIHDTIYECNQLGDYLSDDVIITNIKKFSKEEISDIISKHEKQD
jgi:hypothetical protein